MQEHLQAIETVYNGRKFRSRLEARWAVFFDAVGIKYEHEPEGFKFVAGKKVICYLPDFYLPDFDLYVEIKATREKDDGKAELFALCSDEPNGVLVCYGQPRDHDYRFITNWEADDGGGGSYDTDGGEFGSVHFACRRGEKTVRHILIEDNKWGRVFYKTRNVYTTGECPVAGLLLNNCGWAEDKAAQARFEHGEKP